MSACPLCSPDSLPEPQIFMFAFVVVSSVFTHTLLLPSELQIKAPDPAAIHGVPREPAVRDPGRRH